jgi:Zn-dependent peptidase ImmA (M78 family)/transcriptional regulator with XRE-family HTH domain
MTTDAAASVGARIRRMRTQKGWSQQRLADEVGRTQTAISYWEAGRRSPDLDDLVALAEALRIDIGSLFQERTPQQRARVLLRAQPTVRQDERRLKAIERFVKEVARIEPILPTVRVTSENPVSAAQELLAQARIGAPPIPVTDLAERCGVNVFEAEFDDAVSGVLLDLDAGPVIGFNSDHGQARQRFTIAHELGHFLLRHHDHFHIDLADMASHGNPPGFDWRDERAANEFAAELLMPAGLVIQEYDQSQRLATLASKFKVSREAMGFRLENLRLLD